MQRFNDHRSCPRAVLTMAKASKAIRPFLYILYLFILILCD